MNPIEKENHGITVLTRWNAVKRSSLSCAQTQTHAQPYTGWWMVDASGMIGWAPASFLVPVDEEDLAEEAKENEKLMSSMRGI